MEDGDWCALEGREGHGVWDAGGCYEQVEPMVMRVGLLSSCY